MTDPSSTPDAVPLRIKTHPSLCLGWGECHRWAPEVYPLDDDGRIGVHLLEVDPEHADAAWWGAAACPEQAITVIGPPAAHWVARLQAGAAPDAATQTLGGLVTARPAAARVLERFGLDYCCGGTRTLADACDDAGVPAADVLAALDALGPEAAPDWAGMAPAALVDHLEATHHAYLRDELARLDALLAKVLQVHGARHPELAAVRTTFDDLAADLLPHLAKEEQVLFPMIRELAAASTVPALHCGTVANPIVVMTAEHDRAGDLLAQLRERTDGYAPPGDACSSYTALYAGLAELEADTHLHVHKENNVLFPAVLQLEQRLLADARR